jgi:hypothetical protein
MHEWLLGIHQQYVAAGPGSSDCVIMLLPATVKAASNQQQ